MQLLATKILNQLIFFLSVIWILDINASEARNNEPINLFRMFHNSELQVTVRMSDVVNCDD